MSSSHRTLGWDESERDVSPLRLRAARGGLGIESYRPLSLGPLSMEDLSWSLPGVRFPVDLSGGVRAFHNRRGELEHVRLECHPERLSRWLHPRVHKLLGGTREPPSVWLVEGGLGVGLWCREGALAFDLLWAPDVAHGRLVVSNARSAGFGGPALSHALAVVDAAVGKFGERRGRLVVLERCLERMLRALLPELGVRAPSIGAVRFGTLDSRGDFVAVPAARDVHFEPAPVVARALVLADLLKDADEALLAADPEAARSGYVAALERAPRHPEICQLVAALDSAFAERTEAALGLLVESLPVTHFGLLGAELLYRTGDRSGAEAALNRQVQSEPYAPLAALSWVQLAAACESAVERLLYLDRALGVSPRCAPARWARLEARLETSDVNGAVSDAEHLEASTTGSRERHEALVRAASRIQAAGFSGPAGRLFERALRYVPKNGAAELGLAECLIATGRHGRALPLLTRAAEDDHEPTANRAHLVLAELLAKAYRDLPQAIAHAQRVTALSARDGIEARAHEAIWREQLGDLEGAALCYGRLHELVAASRDLDPALAARHLLEASRFALEAGNDSHAAHRHAALALRLCPKDARVQGRYRLVAGLLGDGRDDAPSSEGG